MQNETSNLDIVYYLSFIVNILLFIVNVYLAKTTKESSQKQHIISLYNVWSKVRDFNEESNNDDIIIALNALQLTATIWNHNVVKRAVIFESYFGTFLYFYNKFSSGKYTYSDGSKIANDINEDVVKAYKSMIQWRCYYHGC